MDSIEHKILTECYPDLITCFKQSPNDIADQLRPSGILAPSVVNFLGNPNNDNGDKARKLIGALLDQVKTGTQVYHKLVIALRASGIWTKSTVRKLEEVHETLSENKCSKKLPQDVEGSSSKFSLHGMIITLN